MHTYQCHVQVFTSTPSMPSAMSQATSQLFNRHNHIMSEFCLKIEAELTRWKYITALLLTVAWLKTTTHHYEGGWSSVLTTPYRTTPCIILWPQEMDVNTLQFRVHDGGRELWLGWGKSKPHPLFIMPREDRFLKVYRSKAYEHDKMNDTIKPIDHIIVSIYH